MSDIYSFACIPGSTAAELISSQPCVALFDASDGAANWAGHIEGAADLSADRMPAWMKRIPKESPVVIYCYRGNASKTYAQMFVNFRYSQVFSVDGVYPALKTALSTMA